MNFADILLLIVPTFALLALIWTAIDGISQKFFKQKSKDLPEDTEHEDAMKKYIGEKL